MMHGSPAITTIVSPTCLMAKYEGEPSPMLWGPTDADNAAAHPPNGGKSLRRESFIVSVLLVSMFACGDAENPNTDTANPSVDGGGNAMLDQGVGPNADGSVASDMSVASDQGMAMTDVFVVTPADSGTAQTADDGMPADAQLQVDAAQSDQGTPE